MVEGLTGAFLMSFFFLFFFSYIKMHHFSGRASGWIWIWIWIWIWVWIGSNYFFGLLNEILSQYIPSMVLIIARLGEN